VSASSDGDRLGPVFVIDSSSLIALKKVIPVGDQWATLVQMSNFVEAGHLAFPRQVAAEMKAGKHPDAPGAWAAGIRGWHHHGSPADESLAEVLAVAQLTDPASEADAEVADPYVVAMAWEIRAASPERFVAVVTEDRVDRMPAKESVLTACQRLGLTTRTTVEFIAWLGAQGEVPGSVSPPSP
jgi:hypothetical protein